MNTPTKPPDQRPQRGFWAPGNYHCQCSECKEWFVGAKRASVCCDCAYKTFKPLHPVDMVPATEPDPWKQTGLTGVERRVCEQFAARQQFGLMKYGVSVEDNPLSELEWHWHHLHELMDACNYVMRKISDLEKNINQTETTP